MQIRSLTSRLAAIREATNSPIVPSGLEPLIFKPVHRDATSLGTASPQLQQARFQFGLLHQLFTKATELDKLDLLREDALTVISHQAQALQGICCAYVSEMAVERGLTRKGNMFNFDTSWGVNVRKAEMISVDPDEFWNAVKSNDHQVH